MFKPDKHGFYRLADNIRIRPEHVTAAVVQEGEFKMVRLQVLVAGQWVATSFSGTDRDKAWDKASAARDALLEAVCAAIELGR